MKLVEYDTAEKLKTTKRRGWVANTPASYSRGSGFKSWPRDRLSWLDFRSFPQTLQENTSIVS
jgi:hypothetical protein